MNIITEPVSSNNYSQSRFGATVNLGVIHTMDGFLGGTDAWFNNPNAQVTAHYGIGLDGTIHRYVSEGDTAWADGNWEYNKRSISIEFEDNNDPQHVGRTDAQYASGGWLIADISRRHSFPADRAHWIGHREVPGNNHPGCPGNEDIDRLLHEAQAGLGGGPVPVAVPAAAASVPGVNPWGPDKVRVTVSTLRVHNSPSTGDAGNFGNTADGMLHDGQLADVNGWVRGESVTQNGVTSDLWCHTTSGHYFWSYDTDFIQATKLPLLANEPAPAPEAPALNFVAQAGTVTVTPAQGANLRKSPALGSNVDHAVSNGIALPTSGYVTNGEAVDGNSKWWKTDNLFVSDVVVSFEAPPAPAAPVAPTAPVQATPVPSPAPATPHIVPKIDLLYVVADAVVHDLAGNQPPVAVHAGEQVHEVGTFLAADGNTYVLSEKSQRNGNLYGYPLDILTAIPPSTKTLIDLRPPQTPAKELKVEATTKVVGAVAEAVSLGERFIKFITGFGRKK